MPETTTSDQPLTGFLSGLQAGQAFQHKYSLDTAAQIFQQHQQEQEQAQASDKADALAKQATQDQSNNDRDFGLKQLIAGQKNDQATTKQGSLDVYRQSRLDMMTKNAAAKDDLGVVGKISDMAKMYMLNDASVSPEQAFSYAALQIHGAMHHPDGAAAFPGLQTPPTGGDTQENTGVQIPTAQGVTPPAAQGMMPQASNTGLDPGLQFLAQASVPPQAGGAAVAQPANPVLGAQSMTPQQQAQINTGAGAGSQSAQTAAAMSGQPGTVQAPGATPAPAPFGSQPLTGTVNKEAYQQAKTEQSKTSADVLRQGLAIRQKLADAQVNNLVGMMQNRDAVRQNTQKHQAFVEDMAQKRLELDTTRQQFQAQYQTASLAQHNDLSGRADYVRGTQQAMGMQSQSQRVYDTLNRQFMSTEKELSKAQGVMDIPLPTQEMFTGDTKAFNTAFNKVTAAHLAASQRVADLQGPGGQLEDIRQELAKAADTKDKWARITNQRTQMLDTTGKPTGNPGNTKTKVPAPRIDHAAQLNADFLSSVISPSQYGNRPPATAPVSVGNGIATTSTAPVTARQAVQAPVPTNKPATTAKPATTGKPAGKPKALAPGNYIYDSKTGAIVPKG